MPVRAGISIAYPGYPYVAVAAFMATATCVFQEQLRQKAMQARPVQGLTRHGFFTLRLTRPEHFILEMLHNDLSPNPCRQMIVGALPTSKQSFEALIACKT